MSDLEDEYRPAADCNTEGSSGSSGSSGGSSGGGSRSATLPDVRELQIGDIVADRYRIVDFIGKGAMGSVYKAEHLQLKRFFALKTLHVISSSSLAFKRFKNEAEAASKLDHPNLVRATDFGLIDHEQPFLVMDLVSGRNLSRHIKKTGKLSLEETMHIFIPICEAVDFAHQAGVVHRDLKPSNIVMEPTQVENQTVFTPKVVDFGIAKLEDNSQALTRTGEIFGTPMYMSPEQCMGANVDKRSDIYSLGCVLYEALTGASPFRGSSALQTMMMHRTEEALSLKEASLGVDFPPELEDVIACMLAKDPAHRYQQCSDIASDLNAICQKYQIGERGKQGQTGRPAQSQPAQARRLQAPSRSNQIQPKPLEDGKTAATISIARWPSQLWQVLAIPVTTLAVVAIAATLMITNLPARNMVQKIPAPVFNALPMLRSVCAVDNIVSTTAGTCKIASESYSETQVKPGHKEDAKSGSSDFLRTAGDDEMQKVGAIPKVPGANDQDEAMFRAVQGLQDGDQQKSYFSTLIHDVNSKRFSVPGNIHLSNAATEVLNERNDIEEINFYDQVALDDGMIKNLVNLPLRDLAISQTRVGDAGLKQLTKIRSLEDLDISKTKITASGLQYLRQFPNLHAIKISGSQADDEGLSNLARVPKLESIEIRHGNVSASALETIHSALPGLVSLSIEKSEPLSAAALTVICKFKNLTHLSLLETPVEDPSPFKDLIHLSHLSKLRLSVTKGVDDGTLAYVGSCSSLTQLDCASVHISGAGVKKLAKLRQLKDLNLSDNPIDDEGAAALSDLPIWNLDLNSTGITDDAMKNIAKMPQLKVLNLANCRLYGPGLSALKDTKIVALNISGTPVTYDYVLHLGEMEHLTSLTVIQCPRLSKTAVEALQKNLTARIISRKGKDEDE